MGLLNRAVVKRDSFEKARPAARRTLFFSAQIQCGSNACDAAKDRREVRYLASEAPALPLPECDRGYRCKCWYRHSEDRRAAPRRRAERGVVAEPSGAPKFRRQRPGRRADDL